ARRARRPARARQFAPRGGAARRAAGDDGLPWRAPRAPPADAARDGRAAARDGAHRALRPVQPWPPDLGALRPGRDRPLVPARTLTMMRWVLVLSACGALALLAACRR